jgi:hypothetical protein
MTRESRKRLERKRRRDEAADLCEHLECLAEDGCLHYDGFSGDSLTRP